MDFGDMLGQLGQTAGGSEGIDWGSPADVASSFAPGPLNSDTVSAPSDVSAIPDVKGLTSTPPSPAPDYHQMLKSIAATGGQVGDALTPASGGGGKLDFIKPIDNMASQAPLQRLTAGAPLAPISDHAAPMPYMAGQGAMPQSLAAYAAARLQQLQGASGAYPFGRR